MPRTWVRVKEKNKNENSTYLLLESRVRDFALFLILSYLCFTCSSVFVGLIGVFFFSDIWPTGVKILE